MALHFKFQHELLWETILGWGSQPFDSIFFADHWVETSEHIMLLFIFCDIIVTMVDESTNILYELKALASDCSK